MKYRRPGQGGGTAKRNDGTEDRRYTPKPLALQHPDCQPLDALRRRAGWRLIRNKPLSDEDLFVILEVA